MKEFPKVLIVANECVSKSTNNGRTLGNLLQGWPKERIAQFCISMADPDYATCDNFYYVSDMAALNSIIKLKKVDGTYIKPKMKKTETSTSRPRKTPFSMVIRNAIWNTNIWRNKTFYKWVSDFMPDIVLFMNGDSYFMHRIALDIANDNKIPMLIFNCEGYYFFDKNIRDKGILPGVFQKIFISQYRKQFVKTYSYATHAVHLNDVLKQDYDRVFHTPSSVLYTCSDLEFKPNYEISPYPKFSYLGTFYFDRYKSLVEIAQVLNEIDPNSRVSLKKC